MGKREKKEPMTLCDLGCELRLITGRREDRRPKTINGMENVFFFKYE